MNLLSLLRWPWKRPLNPPLPSDFYIPHCQCRKNRGVTTLVYRDRWPLVDGGHTVFSLLRCDVCGKIAGFPHDKLLIAIREGTVHTRSLLLAAAAKSDSFQVEKTPQER